MDGFIRISGGDLIHEVEELDASTAAFVGSDDFTGRHFERGEQSLGAVPLVIVALPAERAAIGKLQIALCPLQRLDRGLFVDTDHDGVLRRRQIEPDDLGGLGGKIGIIAFAPRLARRRSIL